MKTRLGKNVTSIARAAGGVRPSPGAAPAVFSNIRVGQDPSWLAAPGDGRASRHISPITRHGFTLIELLVVIAIISLLAAMVFPITRAVGRRKMQARARVELIEIASAIKSYKDKLGQYPPDNPTNAAINPLFYELLGTTNNGSSYITLDGGAQIKPIDIAANFSGATAFANSTQPGGSDETRRASTFLPALKPGRYGPLTSGAVILSCSVPWPTKLPNPYNGLNPIRYNSSNPTNNPNSFDLWVDIIIDDKTNRICNWNEKALIVGAP